jgi:chitinase
MDNRLAVAAIVLAASLFDLPASFSQVAVPTAEQAISKPILTGYFPQWGLYDQPQYLVKNLVTTGGAALLDQLNYAQGFVIGGHCSIADPNADLNHSFTAEQSVDGVADKPGQIFRGYLHQLVELKRKYPHLKLILSLEGRSSNFAEDAKPENRAAFVNSCIDLFIKGQLAPGVTAPKLFDGFDIDWEYPHKEDAANYLALLQEFRSRLNAIRPGLLLNVAVGASPRMYEGTDMGAVSKLVDRVGLMTYDFSGPWSETTGFIAPLRAAPSFDGGSVESTVKAYLAAGVPAAKLLMGIPFYGYGWHQVTEDNHGLFQEGLAIRDDRSYRDIQSLAQQFTVYRDDLSQAPWLFDGDVFWTYEDPVSIHSKGKFASEQHLGGLMIWELSEDTPNALLLLAAHNALIPPTTATPHLQTISSPRPLLGPHDAGQTVVRPRDAEAR